MVAVCVVVLVARVILVILVILVVLVVLAVLLYNTKLSFSRHECPFVVAPFVGKEWHQT